ncbi:MAG: hypothetical protein Q8N95_10720 [Desulfobacterales bacterium]|nr:hypothetical protein [Desulfobacterales bacterium]
MKVEKINDEMSIYKKLIQTLESNYVILKNVEANAQLTQIYEQLIQYLKSLKYSDFINLIESNKLGATKRVSKDDITNEAVAQMTLDDVKQFITDPISSKKAIAKIAVLRFQMRNSEISSLRNKQTLIEHLRTLMLNRETHESISRLAGDIRNGK